MTARAVASGVAGGEPAWRGSLALLRRAGCPALGAEAGSEMPRRAVIVLGHDAIVDVVASAMEALTGAGFENRLIVPELALDFFDVDSKAAQAAFSGRVTVEGQLRPMELIHYDKLRQKKNALLDSGTHRVVVQRVDQYDVELMRELQINPKHFDTRLYVACALFFKRRFKLPTILVSGDAVVQELAALHNLPTCAPADVITCGRLLVQRQAPVPVGEPSGPAPPPPPVRGGRGGGGDGGRGGGGGSRGGGGGGGGGRGKGKSGRGR
ncbi:hypothetical protein NESM_000606700 [Novymonas esmeraldas]|uniref:Uncharacterized protein n=1 Tax=Novymonas esmeraldas TaxID=1808958 RepID=A0AAW0EU54_9TRYP